MTTTLEPRTPMEETYEDVRMLIYHIANRFNARCGGDIEEQVAIGNLAFMSAYETWQPGKATKFSTYLSLIIWRKLHREFMKKKQQQARADMVHLGFDPTDDRRQFDIESLKDGLSCAGRYVLNLVTNPPVEVLETIQAKGGQARNISSTVKEYLRSLGWAQQQIMETWQEVGGTLED
jgi:DNA-directed RNA polymerase specialized sigma24 family protein